MRTLTIIVSVLALATFAACKKDAKQNDHNVRAGILPNGSALPGVISTNVELVANGTYYLNGKTYVKPGGNLIINAGVTVKGIPQFTPAEASALIVTRGGLIHAVGTLENPIVFTSNSNFPAVGDWGGIVILGDAPTNKFEPVIEGIDLPTLPIGVDVHYGGADATDSSGVLKFIRIEWAGASVSDNNELNSLTLGGVGSRTVLDYIQASYGRDDSFEFFGGTVNATHLVSLSTNDDILDFDLGYTGTVQYVLGVRKQGFVYADANGIESDNDASGSADIPKTQPSVSNITIIGRETAAFPGTLYAARFRRNSGMNVTNAVFLGYGMGIQVVSSTVFSGNVIHAFSALGPVPAGNEAHLNPVNSNTDIQLIDPFGSPFDPNTTLPAHAGKGCDPDYSYWFLTWTAGL
ncbi:hypothetical protein [Chitinophaga niabensis]|uniref:Right handed beta helix region n=1 Tax=Chitinophaga niabensis TaxID=536979 RepID=A0A1N6GQX1_9BACT|nr:hypothetical protein [Chitinophaga niabensis]SIO09934.1 hypothetical protein SAMN04488055_2919 [Chitinophaga niabensis]